MRYILSFFLFMLMATACKSPQKNKEQQENQEQEYSNGINQIKYAKGFKVKEMDGFRLVDITDPIGESSVTDRYALVPRGTTPQGIPDGYAVIETPLRRVICMTVLQLSNFISIDALDCVSGITSTRFLFNQQLISQLESKETRKIGIEGNFDTEILLDINPDAILVSPFKRGGYDTIKDLGFPLITFLGYKESSPLGQAEWIKFTAMLLGLEHVAMEKFNQIENRYNELKELASTASWCPTVLSGELHGGNWYVVGGKSYLAHLIEDAGAKYFMQDDNESGGYYVDFETVYSQGAEADFWRVLNSYDGQFTYEAMQQSDARYADFSAFKNKKVLYCAFRKTPFYENSPVEPHLVLADLIKAFHPDLLPDHQPVFYDILK